jgi:hypothetical protein
VSAQGEGLPPQLLAGGGHRVWLRLLGLDILVRCAHEATARDIGRYFAESARVAAPSRSPDCIVECDWPAAGRYLFRARPEHLPQTLEGVRVQLPGDPAPVPWRSHQPPVPPVGSRILAGRFVGLHAAAAAHPSGQVVLFAGERRSGKTTTAMQLTRGYGWTLLTDETVFLLRRTRVVEPFPRSVGLAARIDQESGRMVSKTFVPVDDVIRRVATEPAQATHLVILEPDPSCGEPALEIVRPSDALAHLLPHHLDVGTSADESFVTLLQLTGKCPSAVFRYREPAQLLGLPQAMEKAWRIPAVREEGPAAHDTLFSFTERLVTTR